jgi:hypothetical protein
MYIILFSYNGIGIYEYIWGLLSDERGRGMGDVRNICTFLLGKPERNGMLGTSSWRMETDIK